MQRLPNAKALAAGCQLLACDAVAATGRNAYLGIWHQLQGCSEQAISNGVHLISGVLLA